MSALRHYLFENPYPVGGSLIVIGIALAAMSLRSGIAGRMRAGLAFALAGAAVIAVGAVVTTAGERARAATRALVDRVVAGDITGAAGLFAEDALLHFGQPAAIGHDLDWIIAGLSEFDASYTVESNRITKLRGETEARTAGTVVLTCWTEISSGFHRSEWIVRVERQEDGAWRIADLTFVALDGRAPPDSW
jgi:hypothetical protein